MAAISPQLEDGYTKIVNEIVEALAMTTLSPYESQVLWAIFRKTYGWNKKEDKIPNSQLVSLTGIEKANVSRTVRKLVARNIVVKRDNKMSLQKDYTLWLPPQKLSRKTTVKKDSIVVSKDNAVVSRDYELLSPETDSKEKKRNYTKETIRDVVSGDNSQKDTNYFISLFEDVNPLYKSSYKNKTHRQSIENLRRAIGDETLENVILNLKKVIYAPYAPRITNPYELETKYGHLSTYLGQQLNHDSHQNSYKHSVAKV